MPRIITHTRTTLLMLSCLLATLSHAQEEEVAELIYSNATPIDTVPPTYPQRELRAGREGWVLLSFIVDTDGSVQEAMIEDSSGNEGIEDAALRVLPKWRFDPATRNGEPVEQNMFQYKMTFVLEGATGARRSFIREYTEIAELIAAKRLEEAENLILELRYGEKKNLYEDAWFWWLNYMYLEAREDSLVEDKIASLRRAISTRITTDESRMGTRRIRRARKEERIYIDANAFVLAAHMLYIYQIQGSDYIGAIGTYELLEELEEPKQAENYEQTMALLRPNYEELKQIIDSDIPLVMNGRISEHSYWVHQLSRSNFYFEDVEGELEVVDVRCYLYNRQFTFTLESTWHIPPSWGGCSLYLKGHEGTTFTLFEVPEDALAEED